MTDKPTTAAGYGRQQTELVRATCLYAATKLGDIMDEMVVVGGLVPSLLVKQEVLPHAGWTPTSGRWISTWGSLSLSSRKAATER